MHYRDRSSLAMLERMLNRTTLTVQRVTHKDIMNQGQNAMHDTVEGDALDKEGIIKDAVEKAEERFSREMKFVLDRQKNQYEQAKKKAITEQRQYFEKHIAAVSSVRDKAEEERKKEMKRQFDHEMQRQMRQLRETSQEEKEHAVRNARITEELRIRKEFDVEKSQAITVALKEAETLFSNREQQTIDNVKMECSELCSAKLERLKEIHEQDKAKLTNRYQLLFQEHKSLINYYRLLEADFQELQADYKRFLDYTDGKFHSDYMLRPKAHRLDVCLQPPTPRNFTHPSSKSRVRLD